MPTLRDYQGQPLEWIQPAAFQNFFTLQIKAKTLATARWEGKWTSNLVIAEADGEQWLFKSKYMLDNKVKIYPAEARNSLKTALPLASCEFLYRNERLELLLAHGRSFIWTWQLSATPTLTCTLPTGQEVLSERLLRPSLLTYNLKEIVLVLRSQSQEVPELPLLVLFGLYLGRLARVSANHDLKHNPLAWAELFLGS